MRSLRARLLLTIGTAVLVATVLTVVVAGVLVRGKVQDQALTNLERQADTAAAIAAVPAGQTRVVRAGPRAPLRALRQNGVAGTRRPAALSGLPSGDASGERDGLLYAARTTATGGRIAVVRPSGLSAGDWRPFVVSLVLAGLGGAVVATLFALVLARRLTRPVRRLSDATRAVASGRSDVSVPVEGEDELAELSAAFNAMAAELTDAREAERRFLLSVSHELKSPLTAIRGYAEGLSDGAVAPREAGAAIGEESQRLERLVRDLLDLGQLERRRFSIAPEPVDLATVAARAHERFAVRARELSLALRVEADGYAVVLADPDRLLQAVSNLVENALRVTPAGGTVVVRVFPGRIEVADNGPGLEASDLPHAFDRFYLHDRYRSDRPVGSGLGLALVRELAEAMGGKVSVISAPGQGTAFAIDLQLSQPSAAATRSLRVMGSNGLGITPATPSDA
ncbi:MAG TPA: HAMP domain-containing sensor histidine kinase [Solirubrobacteraceae bacterium]|nr:HAMP domain-containing sensor histidine kinase [Solirubrobacteraceae bacterium]